MTSAHLPGVTVVTPTIPPRHNMLARALKSVAGQSRVPDAVSIAYDLDHAGAGPTRNRALAAVRTEWTAFLDDDDWLYDNHIETLLGLARDRDAKVAWAWFDGNPVWDHECARGWCPEKCHRHKDYIFGAGHLFGITYLVRTELAQQCRFPEADEASDWCGNEDWGFVQELEHLTKPDDWAHTAEVTWHYSVHSGPVGNTSGRGDRW